MNDGMICRGTLAAAVDSQILHTSFAPLLVPQSKMGKAAVLDPPGVAIPMGMFPVRAHGRLAHGVRARFFKDLELAGAKIPSLDEFTRLIQVNAAQAGADSLRDATAGFVTREAPRHYQAFVKSVIERAAAAAKDDGQTLLRARDSLDALRRTELRIRAEHKIFEFDFAKKKAKQRKSDEPLVPLNEIGILFLERLRIRPLGHTVERAPFFELSLEPGETVTLRQKSFSKRASSFESTVEESEERQLEYSSTFTTELAEQYSFTTTDTQNIGATATVQGQYGTPATGMITGTVTGNYGASTSDSQTNTEAASNAQTISRRVATTQKTLHRTVVSVATEESLERESIRVVENTDTRTKKIMMRRLMQVLHLSYERYGARLCWAPCVEEPGRDIRGFVPGNNAFPNEVQAIRDKWAMAPPPEEMGAGPASQAVCGDWSGLLSGGLGGMSADMPHEVRIPEGYIFGQAYLERTNIDGSPNVHIVEGSLPQQGATGVVTIWVHVGLSGGFDAENINYRVCVNAYPGTALVQQRDAAVAAWRQQQAEQEIREFLEQKRAELADTPVTAWPHSELMRRIINDYFGDPKHYRQCEMVAELEQMFEWENLSYRLSAPWWNPGTQVDGLHALRTTFLNASWARVYLPIRPGFEERALLWLMMSGAVAAIPDELEYYLADLRENVVPQYARRYQPVAKDSADIAGSEDILLTQLDDPNWDSSFEEEAGFKVLNRWTVTIPTDGVDSETEFARCDAATPLRDAREDAATAAAKVADSIAGNIANVNATASLAVEKL